MNGDRPDPHGPGGALTAAGALLAVAACCAGPALLTGGVLGAIGGLLGNPLVIAAGALILTAALGYAAHTLRRRGAGSRDDCCPPLEQHPKSSIAPDDIRLEHPAA